MSRISSSDSVFHAIADPTRRNILLMLRSGDMPATKLAEPFDVSQSAVSQHLAILREAGLVKQYKDGRKRIYQLQPEPLREVVDWIIFFEKFWNDKFDKLGAWLDSQS